jgi:hypothetical protein
MKRLLILAALGMLILASCASTWYKVGPWQATAPLFDNAGTCPAPILLPVSATTPRTVYLSVIQGSWSKLDSLVTTAGTLVNFPVYNPPLGTVCTVRCWARDLGGAGCDTTLTNTPSVTLLPPAKPSLTVLP